MLIHSTQTSQNVVHKNYDIASINSRADGCSAVSTFPRSIAALPSLADVDRGTKRSVPSECHSRPSQTTDWRHSAHTPLVAACLDVYWLVVCHGDFADLLHGDKLMAQCKVSVTFYRFLLRDKPAQTLFCLSGLRSCFCGYLRFQVSAFRV